MIKNSLWKRMVFGYIIIALFMLAVSFYLIFRLNHLNDVTDSIMKGDVPAIRAGEKLIDNLIEQIRNEKKYLITKDSAFLDIFTIKKKTFLEKIESLETSVTNEEEKTLVNQIKKLYTMYIVIATKEFILTEYQEIIPRNTSFEEEKEKTIGQL